MKDESGFIYRPDRAELTYEVSFHTPAFDLPSKSVQLLRALYEAINPRFPINTNSMQVQGGNTVADVKVRAFLLNNSTIIDVDVQRMLFATLTGIKTRDDIAIVKDCILLAIGALEKTLPEVEFRQSSFDLRFHADIEGGRTSVSQIMSKVIKEFEPIDIGAEYKSAVIIANYEHQEQKWSASVGLDESQIVPEGLFVHLKAAYDCDGEFKSFQAQEAHLNSILEKLFRGMNLRAETG